MKSNCWINAIVISCGFLFSTFFLCDSVSIMNRTGSHGNDSIIDNDMIMTIQLDDNDTEWVNFTAIFIESTFGRQGLARREGQRQWYLDDSRRRSIDCFCEVMINGVHHQGAEDAVCGTRGRVSCDRNHGCQKATAIVRGSYYSIVRSCGSYELADEHCRQHREQDPHLGNQIVVQRCFCLGWLCNAAITVPHGNQWLHLVFASFLSFLAFVP